ncbi:TOMM precursor leader peptide-binding protein [Dactylosporangium sp. NPDC051484]|uniref:TOMM precursor leader peptide-binding protein n=1 Tax=Dactylosporangium sp. NPDC051484 TaxID=3154942 RepID=UPI00344F1CE6
MSTLLDQQFAPGVAPQWHDALAPLLAATPAAVSVAFGWDLDWERTQWQRSADAGRDHLSVRIQDDEVFVGPLWRPGTDAGCATCAESRERSVHRHPLQARMELARRQRATGNPLLPALLAAVAAHLAEHPLAAGELYAIGADSVLRHRIPRSFLCPVCAPTFRPDVRWRPDPLPWRSRQASAEPTRADSGAALLVPGALRRRLVDDRYGPVQAIMRESGSPFAMSMAVSADVPAWGHGRAATLRETEPVAVIELYERLAGFPFDSPVLMDLAYTDIADMALDPRTLGQHTDEQLNHPTALALPFDERTRMDWVWAHDAATGEPRLVPAEAGFYLYEYRYKLNRREARNARDVDRRDNRKHFHDSSSGCAAGSCLEEAALHSLLELAERDAFLLSWHRQQPLPRIDPASITDPDSRALIDLLDTRGFDTYVFVATQDIDLPIVWAMALNRAGVFPAAYSSGGSSVDPAGAIRSALREVAQLATDPIEPDTYDKDAMLADPYHVEELVHHAWLYTHPETLERTTRVLGGPVVTVEEAWPDWPGRLLRAAGGDVRTTFDFLRARFADAGLDRILVVDQSTREHRDAGIAVAKAVVPGILPMCFGHAQQRLKNQWRLERALTGTPADGAALPYDPHPFP